MELTTDARDIRTSGLTNIRQATIKAGAHMTAVLAGLYKNPVDAMVREYLTNMYDAWVALQRNDPTAVYQNCVLELPTTLSPYLIFRDYGIGMSFEQMIANFFAYGDSTKNGNNDEVGGFGLGSKTAFAYGGGQQWIIESRYNGMHHTIMAFIGDNGIQQYSEVSAKKTTERNGVTIRIPIQSKDITACHTAAAKYVPWYPLPITVLNNRAPFDKPVPTMTGTDWFLVQSRNHYTASLTVLMGNVPYVVDMNQIDRMLTETVGMRGVKAVLQHNQVFLTIKIGSVNIVPSRDDLMYSDRTIGALRDALLAMKKEVTNEVNAKISNAASEYEALKNYRKVFDVYGLTDMIDVITYKGNHLNGLSGAIVRTVKDLQAIDPDATVSQYTTSSSSSQVLKVDDSADITLQVADENWRIMRDDMPKGGISVAKGYCITNFMRKGPTGKTLKYGHVVARVTLIKTTLSAQALQDFFGGIPLAQIINASDYSGKVAKPATKGNDALYRFDGGKSWSARVHVPTDGPYYYVPLVQNSDNRWRPIWNSNVEQMMNDAKQLGITTGTIYGIKTGEEKNFDPTMWLNLQDAVKLAAENALAADLKLTAGIRYAVEHVRDAECIAVYSLLEQLKSKNVHLSEYIREYDNAKAMIGSELIFALDLATRGAYGIKMPNLVAVTGVVSVKKLAEKITTVYPMLGVLLRARSNGYYYRAATLDRNDINAINAYIDSI